MEGIIGFVLTFAIVLIGVGIVTGVRRRRLGVDQKTKHCSRCETPMSLRRVPILESLMLRGMWICPHCGNRTKPGRRIAGATG